MDNTLVLCGGTGAHVGVALLRLHTLGYALGYFDRAGRPFDFPKIFLVDQDSGDGREREETAWQAARRLVAQHPGAHRWPSATGNSRGPELVEVTPLPVGADQSWYKPPFNSLGARFDSSPLLPVIASPAQGRIDYSKGMMGSPAVGSLLFRLKQFDERGRGRNHDETFGQLLGRNGRLVVAGSGVGGTGASVGPTLARQLAEPAGNQVMAVMILNWFQFIEDQDEADEGLRIKAQLRNRVMRQNANSALAFYGQSLARKVAAVPIGMPERAMIRRHFTGDLGQPLQESFVHTVAALCACRHYLTDPPYGPGLYMMGAVESGRLDAATAIPGGTLQDLANQAATLTELLTLWQRVLAAGQSGRVTPAIHDAVAAFAAPGQVAEQLAILVAHYRQQLDWLHTVLAVDGVANHELTVETVSRRRLTADRPLEAPDDATPDAVAAALFDWTAQWIREFAAPTNGLRLKAGGVNGGQWPDIRDNGITAAAKANGELTRINDANIPAVLDAFVDRRYLSSNGWPHPLAAADYFTYVLQNRDAAATAATRQLELMLTGLVAGLLELRPLPQTPPADPAVNLETIATEQRRDHCDGLAEMGLYLSGKAAPLIGFNHPHTLLCPAPGLDEEGDALWQGLWTALSGDRSGLRWSEAVAPPTWGEHDLAVRKVRAWIEAQKRANPGAAPAWTRAFEWYRGDANAPFGSGSFLTVYWDSGPAAHAIRLSLPTYNDDDIWVPPAGTPEMSEAEVLAAVPELLELREGRDLFTRVELTRPDHEGTVWAWWDEHLRHLRQRGRLDFCSRTASGSLIVGLRKDGVLHATAFVNSLVLLRSEVFVSRCTPLLQEPVLAGSGPDGTLRFPDIPIRAEYLDLVNLPEGGSLMDRVRAGESLESASWRPVSGRDGQGRPVVRWTLHLRGRGEPLGVEIRFDDEIANKAFKAQIMVWPNFRSIPDKSKDGATAPTDTGVWRTYYVYDRCVDRRRVCDAIWLDIGRSPLLRRRVADGVDAPYPLSFRTGAGDPMHTSGPPIALALRHTAEKEEHGVYLIHLKPLPKSTLVIAMGIDFGTSHSVAAVSLPGEAPKQVKPLPELATNNRGKGLTLHISEHRGHVYEPGAGLLALGGWLPTYRETGEGILPSEILLLLRSLEQAKAQVLETWQPVRNFTIPPMDIARANLAEYVLTDFKWDTESDHFRGREATLREHYLGLYMELVMAEVVAHHVGGFPTRPIQITFTYPLRCNSQQIAALGDSLRSLLRRGSASFGLDLQLTNGIGLYDESRAARVTSGTLGEVCLVADLGGGTLDLFIAAQLAATAKTPGAAPSAGNGGRPLEVADSVRLGGNLVLRHIAQHPESYLPRDDGWAKGDARQRETNLRAWMRLKGAAGLFGFEEGGGLTLKEMDLHGFAKPADADRVRRLLDRYFRLIGEYLARSLAAYLFHQWFPNTPPALYDDLRISVQLRGNGWRLRYEQQSYLQTTQAIQEEVRRKLVELWPKIEGNTYPVPAADKNWLSPAQYAVPDPKPGPVKGVVNQAMSYDEVRENWYSHTLTDLKVFRKGSFQRIPWHSKIPFDTGATTAVELAEITPPLRLSSAKSDVQVEVRDLEAALQGRVNRALQNDSSQDPNTGLFLAPVAPLVWEAVFESPQFWPDEGR
jgi:hypothetical protein